MALRLSTGIRNFILQHGSLRDALSNGELRIYSGTQPASANNAPSGTLLATITSSSNARVAEVLATGSVTLDSGASGSVDDITVDGVSLIDTSVPFNTSLTQTAVDLAAEINRSMSSPEYRATASGPTVTLIAKRGSGANPNTFVVGGTLSTIAASYTDFSGGVDSSNGLRLGQSAAGTLTKNQSQSWTGVGVANGTAGWYRFVGSVADSDGTDALEEEIRVDGQVATSGAELNLPSLSIATSAVQTITSLQFSLPAN